MRLLALRPGCARIVGALSSGYIIESGNNANGDYVRFADGTQICRSTIELTWIDVAETRQIWQTSSYTPPAAFVGEYDVIVAGVEAESLAGGNIYTSVAFRDLTRAYIWNTGTPPANELPGSGIRGTTYHFNVNSATIRVVAIGRWKA